MYTEIQFVAYQFVSKIFGSVRNLSLTVEITNQRSEIQANN